MLLLGLMALLRVPFNKRLKVVLVAGVLLVGLAGFFWRHSVFFQKGATSVSARFDYWRAAVQTAKDNPLVGTGPGTFAIAYQKIKTAGVRDGAAGAQRLPGAGVGLRVGGAARVRGVHRRRSGLELSQARKILTRRG